MKNINIALTVMIVLLTATNVCNFIIVKSVKNKYLAENAHLAEINDLDSIALKVFTENQILLSENINFMISPYFELTGEDDSKYKLSEILNNDQTLIFRYNEFSCSDCIYDEMGNLKELAKKIGEKNIIILASYENKRNLYVNKRVNGINFEVYNIPHNSLDNTLDNYNFPYMFILDKDFKARNLFIPNKFSVQATKEYFMHISKYF